jgi:hypothetical protein
MDSTALEIMNWRGRVQMEQESLDLIEPIPVTVTAGWKPGFVAPPGLVTRIPVRFMPIGKSSRIPINVPWARPTPPTAKSGTVTSLTLKTRS